MEASARTECDRDNEEEEDLEFFQKTIKVHDRFGGNCDEEDEFFSEDEPDEPISCQKGGYLKPASSFSRSVLSSETKMETISMLDNVRSSCCKSGHDLSLEMLNLKSDEAGLGHLESVFLGKSILSASPPFGDPLSEMDILDSALSLLDDKTCQRFREKGLFDGLVDKNALSMDHEIKAKEEDVSSADVELHLVTSSDHRRTPEPYFNIHDSPDNLVKTANELIHENVIKQDVHPGMKSEPLGSLLSCQIKKSRQSKSASSSRKQLNDSDSLDSKGSSIGREYPPNNLSLDDLVRYINGESLKKVCSRKASTPSCTLPQTIVVNTKKSKKQPVKKHDVAAPSKARVAQPSSRLRKTSKNPSHAEVVRTEDIIEDGSQQEAFCDLDFKEASSGVASTAREATYASDVEHEDENTVQDEFIAVLHRRRVKTRREPHLNQNVNPACGVSLRTKVAGHQSDKALIDKDLGASTVSVFSVSSKSYRSDTSGGSVASKRGSLSSLDESPPLATYETSTLGTSTQNQGRSEAPYSRPTFSKFSAGNSYASALLQNLPKLSVTGSREVSQTEHGAVESTTFSSPLNSEAENEMLLSPPQSEADTGFSSSSSLSPDEVHITLASDSAVLLLKRNEVIASEPRCCSLEGSSMSKHTADVCPENLERPYDGGCVVRDSDSCNISNLDFPLTRISELSGRTDQVQHDAGESSLARSSSDSSCATTQSKSAPVIFDTRIRTIAHKMNNSDIVFLFDAEDSGSDALSNVGCCAPVDDIDGITFTSSPDCMPLGTGALEMTGIHYTVSDVDASSEMKTNCKSDTPDKEHQQGIQVADDKGDCDVYFPQRDSEYENPVRDGEFVERSVCEAMRSGGSFDLFAAQKFLSQAFRSVLKHERECPGQVVRL